jgi:hypothetical protein
MDEYFRGLSPSPHLSLSLGLSLLSSICFRSQSHFFVICFLHFFYLFLLIAFFLFECFITIACFVQLVLAPILCVCVCVWLTQAPHYSFIHSFTDDDIDGVLFVQLSRFTLMSLLSYLILSYAI